MSQLLGMRGNCAAQRCLPRHHSMQALNSPFIHALQASYTLHGTARDGMGRAVPILLLACGCSPSTGCACCIHTGLAPLGGSGQGPALAPFMHRNMIPPLRSP